jgi:2-dehydro-3-deoxyphosphogluconate aldolase/(4S)-4-hydroxy-2-oxoglutarate aldolase
MTQTVVKESTSMDAVIAKIGQIGVLPVIRAADLEQASRAVDAIREGGIPAVEITMTVPGAPALIEAVARQYGKDTLVGAGTVLSADQAKACIDAGAEFIVSPGLSISVMTTAAAAGKLAIPGALTPTELMHATKAGAKLIKIFPCGSVGGPKYVKSLLAPFPNAALVPTGGVNLSNAAEYIAAGAFALGVGAELVDAAALRDGNTKKIVDAARMLIDNIRRARAASAPGN